MRNTVYWWALVAIMILLDLYVFQAIRLLTLHTAPRVRSIIHISYWVISIAAVLTLIFLPSLKLSQESGIARSTVFFTIIGLFFAKLIAAVFFLVDDIRRFFQWGTQRMGFFPRPSAILEAPGGITRSAFLTWTGMLFGGGLFGTLLYGFGNKYKYQLNRVPIAFPNLPEAFKGMKLVHISDIHSGSFTDKEAVKRGVEKIMSTQPDIIVFTGDLVNNKAEEMNDYREIFGALQAPLGVYSILGNHDYGDYVEWASPQEKAANLQDLKNIHAEMGWRLLMNEHVLLEKEGQQIAILGVENWGAKGNFPKYGSLQQAHQGSENIPFKVLLSHDPSHWDAEVRSKYNDIDLMLAGHTHGMQFGVEIPGFKWSPVQYMYQQWAGLYDDGKQKLYVNRGYGFLGYPGRVGILPEITLLEFAKV